MDAYRVGVEAGGRSTIGEMAWETLWQQAPSPTVLLDLQGRAVEVNPAMCGLLGYDREELLRLRPGEVTYSGDPVLDKKAIDRLVAEGPDSFVDEKRLVRSDGGVVWVLINSSLVRRPDGSPQLVISQCHDITARRESEKLWRQTLLNAPIGMALLDLHSHLLEVNDRLCELLGRRRDELLGQRGLDLIYPGYRKPVEAMYADFRAGRAETGRQEACVRHRDGHPFWMLARLSVMRGADDRPAYVVGQYEALGVEARVSEARLVELTRMALHDPLTGLANRALLIERFQQELAELGGGSGVLAVFLIDLDGLKEINDHYGHEAGDQLLQAAARELLCSVRPADTVARVGGDEFVVLAHLGDEARAEVMHARLVHRLNTETTAAGHPVRLGASVGMTTTHDASTTSRALLDSADRDMYARKHARPT
ncbi:sensor domain-containing diguanylate cyclase [Saccharopolyspora rhizosphaerae]|uniref:Sensor domain-containing diguanylate cyclase n=1 Tax=Saccharopolyspora rhizosphaerae TaxID=2492662 RepID=A0A426K1Y2_9PSEU|nr:sensor domain-containing diguanylate cyclase [Saccharopolyspora rhizosphaerae]RRO19334.1 sensor domain-containing diguanylate cyclase [Saccharopolyspora rhizosphaerae]